MNDESPQWQNQAPPPGTYSPTPPKKNWFLRHKVLTLLLGLLLIAGVSTAVNGGGSDRGTQESAAPADGGDVPADEQPDQDTKPKEDREPKGATTGEAVRDGQFEFVVTKVADGPKRIGDEYLGETPQGRFLLITVKVTNIGNEARQLSDSNQKLFDTEGRSYDAHSTAGMLLPSNKVLFENINPGNSVTGTLVFDVPANAKPGKIELHDSMLSGGVTVRLS